MTSPVSAILLAAGAGTRMKSTRPKPLHMLCGRPMLRYVLDALSECTVDRAVIVVGHGAERVTKKMHEAAPDMVLEFAEQTVQRGTGDAVMVGLTGFPTEDLDEGDVLVLPGDTPLLRAETIAALVEHHRAEGAAATLLTARLDDPTGYGRIVRGADGGVESIVEHRDATEEQLAIDEINTSIYCFRRSLLAPALRRIDPDNSQGEFYLTDVIGVLREAGYPVRSLVADEAADTNGVNDRVQLAAAEAELRRRVNLDWMRRGVTMVDPGRTYLDTTVELGTDVTLFPGTILQGRTRIGDDCEIGPDTRLVDTTVGSGCRLEQTTARRATVGDDCQVGPYASLAPGSELPSGTRTGAFYTAD